MSIRELEEERILLEGEIERLKGSGNAGKIDNLRDEINKLIVKIGEKEEQLNVSLLNRVIIDTNKEAGFGVKTEERVVKIINKNNKIIEDLRKITAERRFDMGYFLKHHKDMMKEFVTFFNKQQYDGDVKSGDTGEIAFADFLTFYLDKTFNYSLGELKEMYKKDINKRLKIQGTTGKAGLHNFLTIKNNRIKKKRFSGEELDVKEDLLTPEAKEEFDILLKRINDTNDKKLIYKNLILAQSGSAYEDVAWYFGDGKSKITNEKNEIIFDTKMTQKNEYTGDVVRVDRMILHKGRIMFYILMFYKKILKPGTTTGKQIYQLREELIPKQVINLKLKWEEMPVYTGGSFHVKTKVKEREFLSTKENMILAVNLLIVR